MGHVVEKVVDEKTGEILEVMARTGKTRRIPFAEEYIADYTWLRAILPLKTWNFAATMPQNPHWYTVSDTWERSDFDRAVETIRRYGVRVRYDGAYYTQLPVDGFFYWTMGWPVNETILINRKPFPVFDLTPPQPKLL